MPEGRPSLTDKEKETLRLLVRGYDAKSIARHFQLSVHTVNERLRNARQKMSVSSSREAARLLHDSEDKHPQLSADRIFGEAAARESHLSQPSPENGPVSAQRRAMLVGGFIVMSLIFIALALAPTAPFSEQTVNAPSGASPVAATETEPVQAARQWLALVDNYNWKESWEATGQSFRELNSLEKWTEVANMVQPKLGAVSSRDLISEEFVPAPPQGYQAVKFRSSFKNTPKATETLTLIYEKSGWRVTGYWIE